MNDAVARYLLAAAVLVAITGSLGILAVALRRRWLAEFDGALARLSEVVIGLAALVAILELLGAVGLFSLVPVTLACLAAGGAGVYRMPGRAPAGAPPRATACGRERRSGMVAVLAGAVAVLAGAVVYAEWASPTLQAYDVGIHVLDSFWYHLPWAAQLAQSGHITALRFTDVEFLTAFYPETGELLHGLGIVALGRDTLSAGFNLVWLGLALLAAYCVGRPRGRGAASACGVALVLATPMMTFSQPGGADNDIIGVFLLLSAVALLLGGEGRRPALVLAAVAGGLAASVKLTMLLPVAALTVGVLVIAPRGRRLSSAAWWLGPELLAGGFWYARNLIAVGNPVPWTSLGFLPTPAPALQQDTGYTIAHYLFNGHFWSAFAEPAFAAGLGRWWVVIAGLALAGALLSVVLGPGSLLRMLGAVALAGAAAYLLTPESAGGPLGDPVGVALNIRYCAPALTLCFALLPLGRAFDGERRQLALVAGLAAVIAATVAEPVLWPPRHNAGAIGLGLVVVLAGLALLAVRSGLSWPRAGLRPPGATGACRAGVTGGRRAGVTGGRRADVTGGRRGRAVAVVGAVVLLGAGTAAGYAWQRHYLRGRYVFRPGISYLARVWAMFRSVRHARVGIVGTYGGYFSYPLFGIDDSNHVQYIAHHGPHGSFTPITGCRAWREAVNAARVRYLLTTPKREFWRPKRLLPSPEGAWTATDPAARLILGKRAGGQRILLFELRRPLDPGGCPTGS